MSLAGVAYFDCCNSQYLPCRVLVLVDETAIAMLG